VILVVSCIVVHYNPTIRLLIRCQSEPRQACILYSPKYTALEEYWPGWGGGFLASFPGKPAKREVATTTFLTLLTSPLLLQNTSRHFPKRGRKAEKGTWSVQSVWNILKFGRGVLYNPNSGVSYCNPITSLDNDLTSYFSFFLLSVFKHIHIHSLSFTFW
jgi:hypothetical protein